MLAYLIDQKLLERKLSFWLPLRTQSAVSRKDIPKINFGEKIFDRETLEKELA